MTDINITYIVLGIAILNVILLFWTEYKLNKVTSQVITMQQIILVMTRGFKELNKSAENNDNILREMQEKVDKMSKENSQK